MGRAENKLRDARVKNITNESRLDLAYHAIFVLAKLVLRCNGFKLKGRKDEHSRTLDTLRHTLGINTVLLAYFQKLRGKRHKDLYEGGLHFTATEVQEAIDCATELFETARKLVGRIFPGLFNS